MQTSTAAFIPSALKPSAPTASIQPATPTQPVQSDSHTITAKDGTALDAGVVNLARALRQQESGGNYNAVGDNGTSHGAYQWNKDHFAEGAKQFGLDATDFSPQNQDKLAYMQVKAYKDAGYTPEQVASVWNSGKKDPTGNKGTVMINGKPVSYDTPAYVAHVMQYFNDFKTKDPGQSPQQPTSSTQEDPSLGGFAKNTIESGANFVGNIANAALHPIDTIQNIGGAAVGGLQKLGGQDNENTAKFDNLIGYFKDRYGGVDNLLHTAYSDPVGLAGDISAALGVGGGVVGALGKGAELAGAGNLAREATSLAPAVEGAGLAGNVGSVAEGLGKASELTNPLTPLVKGAGALLNKTKNLSDIIANPSSYTPDEIANSTRSNIGQQVESALNAKIDALGETGTAYNPLRETPTTVPVSPSFLDSTIREIAKVNVEDGVISSTGSSVVRDSGDISKLQQIYNRYKPYFLNGKMSSEEFLNLRSDLGKMAYNDAGFKNTTLATVGDDIRSSLNDSYRDRIPNLTETDAEYSSQKTALKALRKGFIDKDGKLLDTATNKIAASLGKGKDAQLARLEEIIPGITRRLEVMKTLEKMQKGSFTNSLLEKGGLVGGLLSGNVQGAAIAFTSMIISQPEIAVPLLRTVGANIELVKAIMANLAKYTTLGISGNNGAQSSQGQQSQQTQTAPVQSTGEVQKLENPSQAVSSQDTTTNNFNTQGALEAGYSQHDIDAYLASLH